MKRKHCSAFHKAVALLVLAAATFLAAPAAFAGPSQLAMTPTTSGLGPFFDNDNNGWAFTVDSPFLVDGLSVWDSSSDGFGGDMLVTLWEHATQTLLASAVVPAAGDGSMFPTVSISPVALSVGAEYSVAAARADLADEQWSRWANTDVTFNAPISNARQVYGSQAGAFPGALGYPKSGYATAGGNFTYTVIPAPGALLLAGLGTGFVGYLRRRSAI